jgi:GNAT superfamily N-acetyltransferase
MADKWLYVRFDESELAKAVADESAGVELIRTTAPDRERPDCEVTVYSFLEIRELDDEHRAFFQVKHVPAVSVRTSVIGDETYRRVEDLWADRNASANNFQLTVDKGERTARFGPKGMIMVRPDECRGRGIGSYAFGKVVEWGKENYPDYSPLPLELAYRDAADPENRDRRNRFYERFGFRMQYNESERKNTGKAVIDKLGLLQNPGALGKVEVLSLQDAFRGLLKEQGENEDTNRHLEKAVRELSADLESVDLGVRRRNKIIGLLLLLLAAALFLRLYGYV